MQCHHRRNFIKTPECRTSHCTRRAKDEGLAGFQLLPLRWIRTTRPRTSSRPTGGSFSVSASPRVIQRGPAPDSARPRRRWITNRLPRRERTISPSPISLTSARRMVSTSPGSRDGTMLEPRTESLSSPMERITSAASSRRISSRSESIVCAVVSDRRLAAFEFQRPVAPLRVFAIHTARLFAGVRFAANQSHGLEDALAFKLRFLVRLARRFRRFRARVQLCIAICHCQPPSEIRLAST